MGTPSVSKIREDSPRKDLTALVESELHELASVAVAVHGDYGPAFRAMILFAAYVGLRPGELFARQSLDGTGELKLPKNGKPRVVTLPPAAREALLDVPARLDVPWLFVTRTGRRLSKSSLLYYWNPVRAAFGRPGMDFYELRHYCATHLLELGVSHADVAVQFGHTDGGALVMSTYGHPSEELARERLKRAYAPNVAALQRRDRHLQIGRQVGEG